MHLLAACRVSEAAELISNSKVHSLPVELRLVFEAKTFDEIHYQFKGTSGAEFNPGSPESVGSSDDGQMSRSMSFAEVMNMQLNSHFSRPHFGFVLAPH